MNQHTWRTLLATGALMALGLGACSRNPPPESAAPEAYGVLSDTVVCVVDPAAPSGLREVAARAEEGTGRVLLPTGGGLRPLAEVHPVSLLAGYAGREGWVREGAPVEFQGRRFQRTGGARRIRTEQVTRVGSYRGALLFADPGDETPPQAVYLPLEPGCVFQAYVREDLL